ncbi:hypothetical protein A5636_11255 [Mycobacterium asiaticum]|uniref:Uncharacterized protein n=1 Tax=Mycobacterium asiaticum TaxID=1790 RepID=A0A1A3MRN2_MYCAS|nr:hypothetical protein A5636_11255 [Mycobacterium asiaticum]
MEVPNLQIKAWKPQVITVTTSQLSVRFESCRGHPRLTCINRISAVPYLSPVDDAIQELELAGKPHAVSDNPIGGVGPER